MNHTAVQILSDTAELSLEDWQATLDVNLTTPFLLNKSLLPELEVAHGAVVNISSIRLAASASKPKSQN